MYTSPNSDDSFDKYDEPRLHLERLLKARLVEFDLSLRILIPLEKAGIITLGDLVNQSTQRLMRIKNLGQKSVGVLESLVKYLGLSLSEK